jgi:NADP-dependent 3-hydroxy acid dehydrogenase YdfG
VAIVTGASSGLGVAPASALAAAGADVALEARRTGGLVETAKAVEALGRRALVVGTDVTARRQCSATPATSPSSGAVGEELAATVVFLAGPGGVTIA